MKFIARWAFRLLILVIVLTVALVLLKDTILKALAVSSIRNETGLEAKIGKFEIGLLNPTITIENFTLYNSTDFGGSPFLVIPELHVEYDRGAAALKKIHLTLVRFNLGEVNIVQDRSGRLNYQELQAALARQAAAKGSRSTADFTGIDTLNLSVGRIKFTSLKPGTRGWERDLRVNNEIVQNLKSPADLNAALLKVLLRRGLTLFTDGPAPEQGVRSIVDTLVPHSKK